MIPSFEKFPELHDLLDALCEETITAEQMNHLEELVLGDPETEAYYVQFLSQHADLVRHFTPLPGVIEQSLNGCLGGERTKGESETAEQAGQETSSREDRQTTGVSHLSWIPRLAVWKGDSARLVRWGAIAAVGLAAGLLLALLLPTRQARHGASYAKAETEQLDNSVAILLQAPGAVWEDTGLPTRTGAALPPGRLCLKSGFARLEFYSGATVVLEGPADFQLISPKEAYCARGKLRATVPPQAQGFSIGSPKLDLVDRGTEFGLQVGVGDKTEVHVFQGKVELSEVGDPGEPVAHKELTTGQGVRLDGAGQVSAIPSDSAAFSTAHEVAERWEAEMRRRQRSWAAASETVRRDPSLAIYYTFQPEDPWSRTLTDYAGGRRDPHDGAIVGCSWVAGRWPGKQALEFKRVSDRVRLHVPGEFESLTLAGWVRVDALPNRFNSLLMTDDWKPSAPHWHIHGDGIIELGVQGRVPKQKGVHYETPVMFTSEQFGEWTHLAVVYDRDNSQVTHFCNGQAVSREAMKLDTPLLLGNAELGNWTVGNRPWEKSPIRYFTGCMDEFMLFSRALGDVEIEDLYTQGRPPS